jgi:CRP/FNR family transcriptional regulator, cyclic AMP receptor protein
VDERSKSEILAETPLFANLLPAELGMLADLFTERTLVAGAAVFQEGDIGDSVFVIAAGEVSVLRRNAAGRETEIARLGAPQFFGEMSLIDKEYRSATVRATQPTRLLVLSNENLYTFAKHFRNGFTWVAVNIARTLSSRLRQADQLLAERL